MNYEIVKKVVRNFRIRQPLSTSRKISCSRRLSVVADVVPPAGTTVRNGTASLSASDSCTYPSMCASALLF
jgi:hypothetical protein